MKSVIIRTVLCGLLMTMMVDGYTQLLVAYYPLNDNCLDESGNNNHGQLFGGLRPTIDRNGNPCGAMDFNGVDAYIAVADSKSLKSLNKEFSVTCWFKLNNSCYPDGFNWLTILCKGTNSLESPSMPQYRVQCLQSPFQSTISINTEFTEYDTVFHNHRYPESRWNFFALVYDGSFVSNYLNGLLTWKFPYSGSFNLNNEDLNIGRDIPGTEEFYCGAMDDLMIFSSALSEAEVKQLFNQQLLSNYDEFTIKCPKNIEIETDKGKCGALVKIEKPSIESRSCLPIKLNNTSGYIGEAFLPVGNTTVSFLAISESGLKKTCYHNVSIIDNEIPNLYGLNDTILYLSDDQNEVVYTYKEPYGKDNCPDVEIQLVKGPASGTSLGEGQYQIIYEAKDKKGNKSNSQFNITVIASHRGIEFPMPQVEENIIQDSIVISESIEIQNCLVTAVLFDDSQQDFDTISAFYNGEEIIKKEQIKRKTNGAIIRKLKIEEGKENLLIVKAWNNGLISPNTLKIEFYNKSYNQSILNNLFKKPLFVKMLHSRPGLAPAIKIKCKQ